MRRSALPILVIRSAVKLFHQTAVRIKLNSNQPLPRAPVPTLEHTISRYLEYAKVVAGDDKAAFENTKVAADKFLKNEKILQEKLQRIARRNGNWINQFWLTEMYLKIRLALPVNSSPAYIFPAQKFENLQDQINYASWLVLGFCEYKDKIDRKQILRELSTGKHKVQMCMEQYDRILRSYREPSKGMDIQHYDESSSCRDDEHIIAMCNKQAFVIYTRLNGIILSQSEIEYQLQEAFRRSRNRPVESVIPISAGSIGNRDDAGEFWSRMKKIHRNNVSLDWIKTASFIVCLDVLPNSVPRLTDHEAKLALAGMHLLTGFGSSVAGLNRWYDSAIQLVVASNGINGLCIEHSVAEGIVIINMSEYVLDYVQKNRQNYDFGSSKLGFLVTYAKNCWLTLCYYFSSLIRRIFLSFFGYSPIFVDTRKKKSMKPKALSWYIGSDELQLIEKQIVDFDRSVNNLELCVLEFKGFGKTFIKSKKYSPDGFVQLSMQLAYYRLHKKLVSTYESASIRRFQSGRVDNIRAATPEALQWVDAMLENTRSIEDSMRKRKLFDVAITKQAEITAENISGHGIDNHLCALEVLAREEYGGGNDYKTMPELFRDPLWKDVMRFPLSTSQVTTNSRFPGSYLCYGPVVPDGYGCSYNIQPNSIIFAPSAFKSCPTTNAKRFKEALVESLQDMKDLIITTEKQC